ncbi:transferase [Kitasatospora sp. MMS16-BH015]|uniref:transferase n=1 Tax=Kitasatospora sp. MMS16-BH015 TaxID=2018025 RepID=UPI000CA2D4CE|nr:transferase [Kitasatospora sp. MMS16-BH015]AUG75518.1 transferase [Kitasatospora sp. MMS16-BH015]
MKSGLRSCARLCTAAAVLAGYIAVHLAITAGLDLQARDRFRDGPARAAAFTAMVDRYALGDESAQAQLEAAQAWFEANAPAGHTRTTVAAATDLVRRGKGPAAQERASTLAADLTEDRSVLDRELHSLWQATLWFTLGAGVFVVPSRRLRRRRRAAMAAIARTVSRFAAPQPRWRRPLFLSVSGVGYLLFTCGEYAVTAAQQNGRKLPLEAQLLLMPLGLAALGAGFLVLRYARPRSSRPAARALQADGRPPVLYLRSFADDPTAAQIDDGTALNIHSREEQLTAALHAFGPVIAVGRPGEPLPQLGAARFYLPLDDWKPTILELMDLCQLIVLRVGLGEGLRWEISQVVAHQPSRKLVLLTPGRIDDAVDSLAGRLPVPPQLAEVAADAPWLSAAITFGPDWTPHVRAVEALPGSAPQRVGLARRAARAVKAVIWQPSPARLTVRAMKSALAAVGVRGRLIVLRSDSGTLVTMGRGLAVLAVLALLYRVFELIGAW